MTFQDRVAVVALALAEGPQPQAVDGLRPGSLDERALERLDVLPQGEAVRTLLEQQGSWPRHAARVALAVLVVMAAGGITAVVSWQEVVSVPSVIVGTLGLQTLLLAGWVLALLPVTGPLMRRALSRLMAGPARTLGAAGAWMREELQTASGSAAGARLQEGAMRRLRMLRRHHPMSLACAAAVRMAYAPRHSRLAALVYGAWSNGAWVAANLLVLAMLSLKLVSSRTYTLHSGLLSPAVTEEMTSRLAESLRWALPAGVLPGAEAMERAGRLPQGSPADSWQWGCLLVAAVAVWGLLPRVVAWGGSVLWLRAARRGWRIPWDDPRLAATRAAIEGSRPRLQVMERERPGSRAAPPAARGGASSEARAAVVKLGEPGPWPPPGAWEDLGALDGGGLEGARTLAARLSARAGQTRVVVLADMRLAPRRGLLDYVRPLREAAAGLTVVLSSGGLLRRSLDGAGLRTLLDAWRDLASEAGADATLELDLWMLTRRTRSMLAAAATGHLVAPGAAGSIREAMDALTDVAVGWPATVDAACERSALAAVARIFEAPAGVGEAPFAILRPGETAWVRERWSRARDAAREAWRGEDGVEAGVRTEVRALVLRNALLLALELELQGTGEARMAEALESAAEALPAEAPGDAAALREFMARAARVLAPGGAR